eukprot:scaffold668261_cov38-Prasinocladus_malaysianus.AAC.1
MPCIASIQGRKPPAPGPEQPHKQPPPPQQQPAKASPRPAPSGPSAESVPAPAATRKVEPAPIPQNRPPVPLSNTTRVTFNLRFDTEYGQSLRVIGSAPEL